MTEENPICPKCGKEMSYLGHGDNFLFVDGAYLDHINYYYACEHCGYGNERDKYGVRHGIRADLLKTMKVVKKGETEIGNVNVN